jgi:hypothetical protein
MTVELDTYLFPLVAKGACPAGTFELDFASGRISWTEGLYDIHGFKPGQIVPTLGLLLTHLHRDDRGPFQALLTKLSAKGGQAALLHRVIDSRGRQRRVFSSVQADVVPGRVAERGTGFMVDLTRTMHEETRQATRDAINGALANKAVIEQAKGIVMNLLSINPERAFGILACQSQRTNTRLPTLAASLVDAVSTGNAAEVVKAWPRPEPAQS